MSKRTIIKFNIPGTPKSVNTLYGRSRSGGRYIKKEGKVFKRNVRDIVNKINVPSRVYNGRIKIKFVIYFDDRRIRDLDNCMKILWDSLEGYLFENDCQIDDFRVVRAYDKDEPCIKVECENII